MIIDLNIGSWPEACERIDAVAIRLEGELGRSPSLTEIADDMQQPIENVVWALTNRKIFSGSVKRENL